MFSCKCHFYKHIVKHNCVISFSRFVWHLFKEFNNNNNYNNNNNNNNNGDRYFLFAIKYYVYTNTITRKPWACASEKQCRLRNLPKISKSNGAEFVFLLTSICIKISKINKLVM